MSPTPALKVLVVDDSNTIRRSAEIFLKQGGHEVLLADDGFDALAKINDYQPDLVFCDILMPRLDGYQTCAIIKRNARFANIPVVMLSSKDGVFDKARGRMVGAEEHLTKPFTREQLLQAVGPVAEFGFRQPVDLQLARGREWLAQDPARRLLVQRSEIVACIDFTRGRRVGTANRREWWLLDAPALAGCPPPAGIAPGPG